MGTSRRRFSREFKPEAVRMVAGGRHSLAQVARELDLRQELLRQAEFTTRHQARAAIFDYIEGFYSGCRHPAPGYLGPTQYEA